MTASEGRRGEKMGDAERAKLKREDFKMEWDKPVNLRLNESRPRRRGRTKPREGAL